MICDIIESVARETVWRLRADSFQQLTRRSVPVPQSIIVYQHVQHLSYLTVELPRKSLGTLGKARLAKHRLGSQNSMHHDLEMIVTCDVRCVTGKTCCRLIEDINGVIFFFNPLPSEGSENSLRHRDIESRTSWCQTQTFCTSVGRWPPLSGRAVCTFKLTESDASLERCSACDIVWYPPVLDSGIAVLRRVDHLVMLFTCFYHYHRSQLSSWVALHTVDMAGGPFLFPSRCLSMNGTAQQSCGHAAVAMASGDAFRLCDTVVLWIFGHVLLLSGWVISTLCFLWEKKGFA